LQKRAHRISTNDSYSTPVGSFKVLIVLLLYLGGILEKSMAIFSSDAQLKLWSKSKKIVCDASFKYRPQDTYQVYRVFGFVKETHCTPLATILMRRKDRSTYDKMWAQREYFL
jgi:hypothetical protein